MVLNREPIKNWFGYSRRERRSTFVLLLLIVLTISIRYIPPDISSDVEDITSIINNSASGPEAESRYITDTISHFYFDPNETSYDTLIMLGLEDKEARTLINYRKKGGKFRVNSDIKKVYGLNEVRAEKLIHSVRFNPDTAVHAVTELSGQKTLLDLNHCDSASLVRLRGIGPVLSVRIIKYRKLLGGFARKDQLKEVYGLPEETYNMIKGNIYVDTLGIRRININTADYKNLAGIIYFDKYEVTSILKYRELKGMVGDMAELVDNKLLTKEKADKVRPYIKFE
jgi:competence protein ComEA